jgi:hypothetical protein
MNKRYESGSQPSKCPECGSLRIARILYGYPAWSAELEADMKAGRIAIGGCCITGDDPKWKCMECETEIYKK